MRASTQYSNTQKRSPKPSADDGIPVDQVPQQELVLKHADLVKRIAYHLVSRMPPNVEVDDLIQSGMIGLLDAAKHYSANKGANFETYAGIRIRGAMLDEVRKSDWTPRSVHRNMREMADVIRKIENEKGQDASPSDIAQALGVTDGGISQAGAGRGELPAVQLRSDELERRRVESRGPCPGRAARALRPYRGCGLSQRPGRAIGGLPEREKLVLSLYYDEDMNLREIGEVLEVSESRVCQIHGQALVRLRSRLSEWLAPD